MNQSEYQVLKDAHEEIARLKEDLGAAKANGQLWEEDMKGLCGEFGVEITVDNIDNAADRVVEIYNGLKAEVAHAKHVCSELLGEIRAYQGEGEFEEGNATKDHCDLLKSVIDYKPSDELAANQYEHHLRR